MTDLDPIELGLFALKVWKFKEGESVAAMIHLGDRLGLYRAMAGAGPLTAEELAARTETHPRWVLEWLRSQAAADLLLSDDGVTFELPRAGAEVLANEEGSLAFAAGAFHGSFAPPGVVDRIAEAFRTGRGLSFDDLGPEGAHGVERMLGPWTRLALVPTILPALDGVVTKLAVPEPPARVVDVGCGAGLAVEAIASAFPWVRVEGWDPSHHAVEIARQRMADAGVENVTLHEQPAEALPAESTYDLVLTLDCIHDMPHPDRAIAAIRRAIKPDGTWLIKDIRGSGSWEENRKNPVLAMMYATSVGSCMSSALSEPDGMGLGTLGFHPEVAERMVRDAGFTSFTVHDFDDPANLYYEVRP